MPEKTWTDEDIVKFLTERIKQSGLSLENDVAKTLKKSNNKTIILNRNQGNEFISLVKEKITKTTIIESNNINDNKIHIYSRTMSNGKTSVFMSLQIEQSYKNTTTLLTAELASDYLWDTKSKTYATFNVCIVNEGGGILYCSQEIPKTITLNNSQRTFHNKKIEHWSSKDGDYISASKTLFLKSKFDSTNWKVIITQSEKDVLSPASTFNRLFPLVILLTLLVVLLLSITQIQRILIPLKKLISGTRRVANRDFNETVEVESNDGQYNQAGRHDHQLKNISFFYLEKCPQRKCIQFIEQQGEYERSGQHENGLEMRDIPVMLCQPW